MATHFARGILTEGHLISVRLPSLCHQEARNIPPHRQSRFLASRGLLAELMFMLYGIGELPEIVTLPKGKPVFSDKNLPSFSVSYAGKVNVASIWNYSVRHAGFIAHTRPITTPFPAMNRYGSVNKTILTKRGRSSSRCAEAC